MSSVVGDPPTFEEMVDELTTNLLKSRLGGAKHQAFFVEWYDWDVENEFFNAPPTKRPLRSIIDTIGWVGPSTRFIPLYKAPATEADVPRKEKESNCFPHGYVVDMKSNSGVSPRDRAMPPPENNTKEDHDSERTARAVKIMSAFGKATTVFKQKDIGGVYEYATYLHNTQHNAY